MPETKYSFPSGYGVACYLVPIDAALVPLISGALRVFLERSVWSTWNDYEQGYNAFGEVYAAMANNCATEIIEGQNRLYRLLDTALNGVIYDAPTADPADIVPAIPMVPVSEVGAAPGLRRQLLDAQGELPAGFMGLFPRPATTTDLVEALRAGSDDEVDRVTGVLDVLQGAGSSATIFNAVREFFADGASISAEGLMLATMIASTMANAALMGLQGAQLDALLAKLDRVIEQLGVAAAPLPAATIAGELGAIRDNTAP